MATTAVERASATPSTQELSVSSAATIRCTDQTVPLVSSIGRTCTPADCLASIKYLDGCIVWNATIQYSARSARLSVRLTNCRIMPIGRILKVTRQGAEPGAKSDVYLFVSCYLSIKTVVL